MSCDMTHDWFDRWLSDHAYPLPREVANHLAGCRTCREMIALLRQTSEPSFESKELQMRVSETLRLSLTAVRPLPSRANLVARVAVCLTASGAGIACWTGWAGMASLSWGQASALTILTMAALLFLAYSLSALLEPGAARRVSPAAAMAAAATALLLSCAIPFPWDDAEGLVWAGWGCGRVIAAGAIPVLAILLLVTRRGMIVHPVWAAGTMVGTAAIAPLASIQFACPAHEATHLIAWHWGVWFLLLLSALLGTTLISEIERRIGQARSCRPLRPK